MNLKTYQAYTMAEALAAVKRDLGASAVILNTRSYSRGGVLGLGRRTIVEVTATAAADAMENSSPDSPRLSPGLAASPSPDRGSKKSTRDRPAPDPTLPAIRRRASRTATASPATPGARAALRAYADRPLDEGEGPSPQDKMKTRRLAQAMLVQHERRKATEIALTNTNETTGDRPLEAFAGAAIPGPEPAMESAIESAMEEAAERAAEAAVVPCMPVARRFILKPTDSQAIEAKTPMTLTSPGVRGAIAQPRKPAKPAGAAETETPGDLRDERTNAADESDRMRDELSAIRQMVGEVLQRQVRKTGAPTPSMPQSLFDMYLLMLGQDLSEEVADRVVNEVRDELTSSDLEDDGVVRAALCRRLSDLIPSLDEAPPTESPDGRPLTLALVGPTGVGKTTTLAKLAASFKLRHRRKVGLVTADTYRIAAVDQLRTYANIIGLPVRVVLSPGEMRQAIHSLSDCDVILIDTAGRSQKDQGRLDELKAFIDAADPHEVHLVLSSTASEKVLLQEAEAFGAVGVDKVVLTKLDEAVSFGVLVNVIRKIGKRLSFFTTGQEVPDHLEIGQAERLADLVLGGPLARDRVSEFDPAVDPAVDAAVDPAVDAGIETPLESTPGPASETAAPSSTVGAWSKAEAVPV